jgi:hypothetical protein
VDIPASPLFDLFRRGEVPREVRLLAAQGVVAPRVQEQLAILVWLTGDRDAEIADVAARTLASLPSAALERFLAAHDVPEHVRAYFAAQGMAGGVAGEVVPVDALDDLERELELLMGALPEAAPEEESGEPGRRPNIATLPIIERMKLAMRGTREQRAVLVRDANRLVSAAVLSSPKLTDTEVESFSRMANVSEDVLRTIGTNRGWVKHYGVALGLVRNPKTPPAVSMPLVARLNERDLRGLAVDRNVPEGLRLNARKLMATQQSRRQ